MEVGRGKPITYPGSHEVGVKVPKGGSSCANCRHLKPGIRCDEKTYVQWNGSDKIPTKAADEYCCDLWQGGEREKQTLGDQLRDQKNQK